MNKHQIPQCNFVNLELETTGLKWMLAKMALWFWNCSSGGKF